MTVGGAILVFDTATTVAVAAVGAPDGRLVAGTTWTAGYRHGEELLARVDALLAEAEVELAGLGAIVVGTGPGAFTGLRVGLATAKGLAHALGVPIVGIPTRSGLLAAAAAVDPAGSPFALVLPAGPSDRLFIEPDGRTTILAADPDVTPAAGAVAAADEALAAALDGTGWSLVAVDLVGRAPEAAVALGECARAGLGAALLELGAAELAAGRASDLAELVPDYVTLPRGVRQQTGTVGWSRDPA